MEPETPVATLLFRRKPKDDGDEPSRRVQRQVPQDLSQFRVFLESHDGEVYRGEVDEGLVVQVGTEMESPVQARLVDLSIQGACVIVPLPSFPALTEGEIVGVRIEHAGDQWQISTPGLVRRILFDSARWVRIGLEFVNPGNLFAQLQNDHGQYFNRRREWRVTVGEPLDVLLRHKGSRVQARVADLSVCGMGGWMDHVQGSMLPKGANLKMTFQLPDEREAVEGPAQLVYKGRAKELDRIGVAFDLEQWSAGAARAVRALVDRHLDDRFRWTA